jgi:hypothetical protein
MGSYLFGKRLSACLNGLVIHIKSALLSKIPVNFG